MNYYQNGKENGSNSGANNNNNFKFYNEESQEKLSANIKSEHSYARSGQLWTLIRQKYMLTFRLCRECSQELFEAKGRNIEECSGPHGDDNNNNNSDYNGDTNDNDDTGGSNVPKGGVIVHLRLCKSCTAQNMEISDLHANPKPLNNDNNYRSNYSRDRGRQGYYYSNNAKRGRKW
uniref:Uncharacterized protein n=1 Tax=Globodera rostochiensis TaxID=31243 RepID=A0A914GQY1_GLORO